MDFDSDIDCIINFERSPPVNLHDVSDTELMPFFWRNTPYFADTVFLFCDSLFYSNFRHILPELENSQVI